MNLVDNVFVETCTLTKVDNAQALNAAVEYVPRMKKLIQDTGFGLAAPQVGIGKKYFIARDSYDGPFYTYFNAYYVGIGNIVTQVEGCLTYPDKYAKSVPRYESIRMYYDILKNEQLYTQVNEFDGRMALVLQHECDHIGNGNNTPITIYKGE